MKTLLLAASLALASFAASAASFDFSFTGGGTSTSGTFTTDATGDVIGITGTYSDANVPTGTTFSGVAGLGTDAGFSYDNLFNATTGFDNGGALFHLSDGHNVNFYADAPGNFATVTYTALPDGNGNSGGNYSVTTGVPFASAVSAVPEGSPFSMTLAGLALLAGVSFLVKRAKSTVVPAAPAFA